VFDGSNGGSDFGVGFESGEQIDLSAYAGLTFADLAISQVAGGTLIEVSQGSIQLDGFTASQLTEADFIFG